MTLNLYDKGLNRITHIGSNYLSCLWKEYYNQDGTITLELAATDAYASTVKPDCYIGRTDRRTMMVIKTVELKDSKIVATGKTATSILDDVAYIGTIKAGSSIPQAIKGAYDSTDKFTGIEIRESDITLQYGSQISNKSISDLLLLMCAEGDIGYRTVREENEKIIYVEFYRPEQNTNLKFAERFGNLSNKTLMLSTNLYKNYAIVLGAGEDGNRFRVDVDVRESLDEQKREIIIDARDLQLEDGETEDIYKARLEARGREKLLECVKNWEAGFAPSTADFGIRYDLGDIITVLLPEYKLKIASRIVSFQEKSQKNKTALTIEVGDIILNKMGGQ